MTELNKLVTFLRDETDGTLYQLLNRRMMMAGTTMDETYRKALRIVVDETAPAIEANK